MIHISYGCFPSELDPWLNPNIPKKYILEHERNAGSLGLRPDCYGIKINDYKGMERHKAWEIIEQKNPQFTKHILTHTKEPDLTTLDQHYAVVPIYATRYHDFGAFLYFVILAQALTQEKDIIIHNSGGSLKRIMQDNKNISSCFSFLFEDSMIKNAEIIFPDADPIHLLINNTTGTKNIKIFSGFYLQQEAYDAVYQLAIFAGVSGDNTFEKCISMGVFHFIIDWLSMEAV